MEKLSKYKMSGVTCCVSPVTCHMSLKPTATATDPPRANSPLFVIKIAVTFEPIMQRNQGLSAMGQID